MSYECVCDGDYPEVYERRLQKARKTHKCDECWREIKPGEQYEYTFSVLGGDVWPSRTCSHCLDLRDFVVAHIPCSCWQHGSMIDDVMEDAKQWAHQAPGLLFGAYRRRVHITRARIA